MTIVVIFAQNGLMKITEKIDKKIDRFNDGSTFTYQQLGIESAEFGAAAKAMGRLVKKGTVQRASTGLFYKPKKTAFGVLKPKEEELLKPYLFEGNNRTAYVTGPSLYNRLGLTTQISNNIKVASRNKRVIARIGNLKISPVKSYVDVTNDNYYLLEILDALKDFKKIPDRDQQLTITRLTAIIKELKDTETQRLVKYALNYPPRVPALLGALLDNMDKRANLETLKRKLNPLTVYSYGIRKELLPTKSYWNIE